MREKHRTLFERRDELWRKVRDPGNESQSSNDEQAELDALENVAAMVHADLLVQGLAKRTSIELKADETKLMDWVTHNKAFDEMCLDFMAPIMQGALSPTLARGDALAFAWRGRFDWFNSSNLRGYAVPSGEKPGKYAPPTFAPYHPSILFNTCDANQGSRVVVGFPAIPQHFWQDDDKATFARTTSINEHNNGFEVSLPRAVRFSSNFPFGFRLADIPCADGRRLHLIDGGVVDNTGLDTFRDVFRALAEHADPSNKSPFQKKAKSILDMLRERGVIILEIDAGAKPVATNPSPVDPLGGTAEQLNALSNAAYTNAELVKSIHVADIRKILNVEPAPNPAKTDRSPGWTPHKVPTTMLKIAFQCNHYLQGEVGSQKDVMTAWSLGPQDKAQVVHRFLIELGQWDRRRKDACDDVRSGLKQWHDQMRRTEEEPEAKSLVLNVKAASKELIEKGDEKTRDKLGQELSRLKGFMDKSSNTKLKSVAAQVQKATNALNNVAAPASKKAGEIIPKLNEAAKAAQEIAETVYRSHFSTEQRKDPQAKYDRTDMRQRAVFDAPVKPAQAPIGLGKPK